MNAELHSILQSAFIILTLIFASADEAGVQMVLTAEDGSKAVCVANYDRVALTCRVLLDGYSGAYRARTIDDDAWSSTDGVIVLPPRSAAVVIPEADAARLDD